ncbi:sugar phosphate isomerase/epimerase family protein [Chryseolinea lacunae]|uniref:Sugar phosphate isomerase/epimerase n=1 Tax=Chryseolinea lacunae TaxID=2801331 RepID=A0ABS1KMY2_9BACT|nr:sugar phosphate isomerase/epimerase [Chryseolinea lacunae]MBL0740815.1 sugar phosphate isomerase/epimerase [Chryseolinea lacunae]
MTTRRDFLKQAGVFTSALCLTPNLLAKSPYKLGLQLYTIRDAMAADAPGTLKKISSYGYQEVEIYGFDGKYYGMTPADFKKLLSDNNLTSPSGHYNLDKFVLPGKTNDDLLRYVDLCIEGAHMLKQDYIVWPWLDPSLRSLENIKMIADTLDLIGERIRKGGLQLAYHNHDFEFVDHDGKRGYDIILATNPDNVKLELDLYWASFMKQNLAQLFERQPGRFVIWHLKDMDKTNPDLHTTMGDGSIDFKSILPLASKSGVKHMFVEQGNNYVPDAMQCVARSAKYTKRELLP